MFALLEQLCIAPNLKNLSIDTNGTNSIPQGFPQLFISQNTIQTLKLYNLNTDQGLTFLENL